MARVLIVCALALLPAGALAADNPLTETVVKFHLQPMAAPRPALKYQLLPELREMSPGNPMYGYLKCFMEHNHFYFDKEAEEKREKYNTMPLADLPLKELQNYGGASLRQADWAARLDAPDWQILLPAKRDGVNLLLPDLQQHRRLASALKVRFRVEVAERRFPDAIRTAKTMFALARHHSEHPTLIGNLVGMAIAQVGLGPLEEMISQPGCPNLYSALTNLPDPFINLQKGARGETLFIDTDLGPLTDKAPMAHVDLIAVGKKVRELLAHESDSPKGGVDKWVERKVTDEAHLKAARKRLVEGGLAEGLVKKFPPLQVLLLDEKLTYEDERDQASLWIGYPYWEIEAKKLLAGIKTRDESKDALFAGIVAAYGKVKGSQARVQQRFAMVRVVEALRLHAAETGKLPAKLDEVKVPLPVDPVTGKSFPYSIEGNKATLRGTPPHGLENAAAANLRYEITLQK